MKKRIDKNILTRTGHFDRAAVDEKKRTVEMTFSSEKPYRRYFGDEILDHSSGAIKMDFLSSGNAPLLLNHWRDDLIGVVDKAWIGTDRRGHAIVRFSENAQADEVFRDVVSGIRSNVSVGYLVKKMVRVEQNEDDADVYKVTDWEPKEISIVSIPADESVGVGRAAEEAAEQTIFETIEPEKKDNNMEKAEIEKIRQEEREKVRAEMKREAEKKAAAEKVVAESRKAEQDRVNEIREAGTAYNRAEMAQDFINRGKSVGEFMKAVADDLAKKDGLRPLSPEAPDVDMSNKERSEYSLMRLITALDPNNKRADAGFELEISAELAKKSGKSPRGAFIPYSVLTRDLNTSDDSAMVGTDHLASQFIDVLRNRMVLAQAGATFLPGPAAKRQHPAPGDRRVSTTGLRRATHRPSPNRRSTPSPCRRKPGNLSPTSRAACSCSRAQPSK
jgi:HK97 family phage prohead protease